MSHYPNGRLNTEWLRTGIIIIVQLAALLVWGAMLSQKVDDHLENADVHMTLERKIDTFVPRTEIENRLQRIEEDIKDIKKGLNIK